MRGEGQRGERQRGDHGRGAGPGRQAARGPARLHGARRVSMRVLHVRHDHEGGGLPGEEPQSFRGRDRQRDGEQPVPLRRPLPHPVRGRDGGERDAGGTAMSEYTLSRRSVIKVSGAGISLYFVVETLPGIARSALAAEKSLPTDFNAFLRIAEDGRITCYVGKVEYGQGVNTSLRMMLADELDVAFEATDIIMGDTAVCPWDRG